MESYEYLLNFPYMLIRMYNIFTEPNCDITSVEEYLQ